MPTDTLGRPSAAPRSYLRECRSRLKSDAGANRRRRTPGLRREEVGTRAGVSVTWYTRVEQVCRRAPSAEVLMRLAASLGLDTDNREYRLLLAQHRPPPLLLSPSRSATPALQRVPVGFRTSPAIVETPTDGCSAEADALIEELQATRADFRRLHADMEARSHGVGIKRLTHPEAGLPTFEYAAFSVDGADGLTLIVFSPASDIDAAKVASTFPQHAPIPLTADLRT